MYDGGFVKGELVLLRTRTFHGPLAVNTSGMNGLKTISSNNINPTMTNNNNNTASTISSPPSHPLHHHQGSGGASSTHSSSCCGHVYHLNTDTSWKMKLRYSYPPGQQHGTTDLVYSGSVILLILMKTCCGHIFANQCHTRPPTFSVVLSLVQECLLRTLIPGPHHTKGPLTLFFFSSATIDTGTYATDDCYTIMLARTGLPDPYY
jgi:hypothetical protein